MKRVWKPESPPRASGLIKSVRLAARGAAALLALLTSISTGSAQGPSQSVAPDRCLALSHAPNHQPRHGLTTRSLVQQAQLKAGEIRLSFVGHSTFLIESPKGITAATDYNDYVRPAVIPVIATMNRAHTTHYTPNPDPGIRHVLRGWSDAGGPAIHDVTHEDVRVRNVPTNIRGWDGGTSVYGNSIFVFETANLCVGHLGHLHHTLTTQQLAQIGQLDVVLVPVDGSFTLDVAGMVDVLRALKAPLMVPMHYFSSSTLNRFLDAVRGSFEIRMHEVPTIVISRATLPAKSEILVLPGN